MAKTISISVKQDGDIQYSTPLAKAIDTSSIKFVRVDSVSGDVEIRVYDKQRKVTVVYLVSESFNTIKNSSGNLFEADMLSIDGVSLVATILLNVRDSVVDMVVEGTGAFIKYNFGSINNAIHKEIIVSNSVTDLVTLINTSTSPVQSVNGETGEVVLNLNDVTIIGANSITLMTYSGSGTDIAAIDAAADRVIVTKEWVLANLSTMDTFIDHPDTPAAYVGNAGKGLRVNGTPDALEFFDLDTDNIAEGANLYYTQARFDAAFAAKDTDGLSEGAVNFYYTEARFDASLATKFTTDLAEGVNLYYTDERVDDRVNDLIQDGTGLVWTYDDGSNTLTGNVSLTPFDTDALSEGASNFYYTEARFDASLATKFTTDLAEGVNLYFTDERAQDAVGGILTDTATVNFTYNDPGNTITADVIDNTSTQKVIISKAGANIGTRQEVNFIEGSNVTLTIADDGGSDRVNVTIAASGGGADGNGIFDAANDGGTVPTTYDITITDTIAFTGGDIGIGGTPTTTFDVVHAASGDSINLRNAGSTAFLFMGSNSGGALEPLMRSWQGSLDGQSFIFDATMTTARDVLDGSQQNAAYVIRVMESNTGTSGFGQVENSRLLCVNNFLLNRFQVLQDGKVGIFADTGTNEGDAQGVLDVRADQTNKMILGSYEDVSSGVTTDSPFLKLRSVYDSEAGAGVTVATEDFSLKVESDMPGGGGALTGSRLMFKDNADVTLVSLDRDGVWVLKSYTVAGSPSASASNTGGLIFISDETGGATVAFSDGTNFRRVQDRTIIA